MLAGQQQEEREQEEERYLATRFKVDPERLATQDRSMRLLLLHRRCAACWGTLIQEPDHGLSIEADEHLEQIASHCFAASDFIHHELPVMEAVFRILVGSGNQSMVLEDIYQILRERWSDPTNPRTPQPEKLYRTLSADIFYGIVKV